MEVLYHMCISRNVESQLFKHNIALIFLGVNC